MPNSLVSLAANEVSVVLPEIVLVGTAATIGQVEKRAVDSSSPFSSTDTVLVAPEEEYYFIPPIFT